MRPEDFITALSSPAPVRVAPVPTETEPNLAARMRQMHVLLIQSLQRALTSYRQARYEGCVLDLGEFDRMLRSYLGNEEAELEDTLTARCGDDAQHLLVMRQVRARLRQLARQVHEMLQPPHPSRPNPARAGGNDLMFDNLLRTVVQCVDASERELLPLLRAGPSRAAPPAQARPAPIAEAMPIGSIWRRASMR